MCIAASLLHFVTTVGYEKSINLTQAELDYYHLAEAAQHYFLDLVRQLQRLHHVSVQQLECVEFSPLILVLLLEEDPIELGRAPIASQ